VFGGAWRGILALAGIDVELSPTGLTLVMATEMSLGMVVWMRHRGHDWASTFEMAAAMYAAPLVLIPLLRLEVVDGDTMLMLEHLVMLPLMYLVMLRRREEYAGCGLSSG
jgi:flagellar biosynthetic protein FliP